jgi:nitrite reductase/ring-hydroxylating ferredoxin subunit/multimeric flavodoxin WrbA
MTESTWHDLGSVEELAQTALRTLSLGRSKIALSYANGEFGAIHNACNHVGGPLGEGTLDGEYVVCPWHNWKFHRCSGKGEPGYEADAVPHFELKQSNGHLFVREEPASKRSRLPHPPHALERPIEREAGALRVVGISTTAMDESHPRYSTSDDLLQTSLEHAEKNLGAQTRLIRLSELSFRSCEGYYSKSAKACTWPCSITQMDPKDQMDRVYEAVVFWADVILVTSPIRWGSASSLYFKMIERMNCIQNQVTIRDRVMLKNKVASFIITGGQDNIQAVAGQMLMFFAEIGCHFPQFPFIAHSRGWSSEDMERNTAFVRTSPELHQGARELVERALGTARGLLELETPAAKPSRGGRKAHRMEPSKE